MYLQELFKAFWDIKCMDEQETPEEPKELRVKLGPKLRVMIQEIKEEVLLENYSEIVRLLIKEKYDRIQLEKRAVDLSLKEES